MAHTVIASAHPAGINPETSRFEFPAETTEIVPFDRAYVIELQRREEGEGMPPHPRLILMTGIPLSAAYRIARDIS